MSGQALACPGLHRDPLPAPFQGEDRGGLPRRQAHSHLFPHLLEVIEQLQSSAQPFGNETAALAAATHEPVRGTAS